METHSDQKSATDLNVVTRAQAAVRRLNTQNTHILFRMAIAGCYIDYGLEQCFGPSWRDIARELRISWYTEEELVEIMDTPVKFRPPLA